MFRRPQPENFFNYQLQASLGRRQQGSIIPIKRRKKTKIKKEKRNDSFLLRQQDIDKRRAVYRPDRLLELHQSALTNATRTATEIGRGLTATGTTLGFERQQIKDESVEKAKGRVLLALANKLEQNEPLINVGIGYSGHRIPEDFNAVRLPDKPQEQQTLGYREPRPQPAPSGYASHRKPTDLNAKQEPLIQSFEDEPEIEDVTDQTPIPRVEKPKVGKLDPIRTQALEGLTFQVADADDPRVKQATQDAKSQRNIARTQAQPEPEPQLRKPQPVPEPEPTPEPEPSEGQPRILSINKPTEVPPSEFQPLSQGTPVRNLDDEGIKQGLAVAKAKERREQRKLERQQRLTERFTELKDDITEPEQEGEPPDFPLRRETPSIQNLRQVVEDTPSVIRAKARQELEEGVFKKPEPRPPSNPLSRESTTGSRGSRGSREPTPPTSGRTTPARQLSGRTITPTGSAQSDPPEPLVQNFVEPKSGGVVEDLSEADEWLENLPTKSSFHSGIKTNELTGSTYSFVDTDGLIGSGKFKGKELAILGVNKNGNVLLQLKDSIGTGKVDASVRANISYKKFKANLEDLNLKPLNP